MHYQAGAWEQENKDSQIYHMTAVRHNSDGRSPSLYAAAFYYLLLLSLTNVAQ